MIFQHKQYSFPQSLPETNPGIFVIYSSRKIVPIIMVCDTYNYNDLEFTVVINQQHIYSA